MHRTTRQRRFLALGAAALLAAAQLGAQSLTAAPAAAATIPPGSVVVVSVSSGFSVSADKTVTAQCPATNPRVLGGGFTTTGQHIEVTELRPMAGLTDSYRVTAVQDEVGTTASWQLLGYAYCSSVAPGWQLITTTSSTTSDPFNAVYPNCPSGKYTTGGGGQINGGSGQVKLLTQGAGGVSAPRGYGAAGLEDNTGFAGTWSVTGYLICVTYGSAIGDFQMVQNQTANDATTTKTLTATCASGKRVTGSAAWIDNPGTLISLRPNNATNPTVVTAVGRNDTAGTGSWTLYLTVFCAS